MSRKAALLVAAITIVLGAGLIAARANSDAGEAAAKPKSSCGSCSKAGIEMPAGAKDCSACPAKAEAKSDCGATCKGSDKKDCKSACGKASKSECGKACKSECGKACKSGCGDGCKGSGKKGDCAGKSACSWDPGAAKMPTLNPAALNTLMKANPEIIVVDARGDVAKGMIPGAKHLPSGAEDGTIAETLSDKDAMIVTYCGSTKCAASTKLATRLRGMGYNSVIEMPAGIAGWQEAGMPVAVNNQGQR